MKFIADVMLGRLAKRMRLWGFDVLYDRTLGDNEIIHLSLAQDRIILTRDTGLANRPLASRHLFIESDHVRDQILQVLSAFPAERSKPLTRCAECNTVLALVPKQEVRDLVPLHVYQTKNDYLRCENCGRIYWLGSHVQRMAFPATGKLK